MAAPLEQQPSLLAKIHLTFGQVDFQIVLGLIYFPLSKVMLEETNQRGLIMA